MNAIPAMSEIDEHLTEGPRPKSTSSQRLTTAKRSYAYVDAMIGLTVENRPQYL